VDFPLLGFNILNPNKGRRLFLTEVKFTFCVGAASICSLALLRILVHFTTPAGEARLVQ
jgi:hypothetical protein